MTWVQFLESRCFTNDEFSVQHANTGDVVNMKPYYADSLIAREICKEYNRVAYACGAGAFWSREF